MIKKRENVVLACLVHSLAQWFSTHVATQKGREPCLEELQADILCTQLSYIYFIWVFSGVGWIRVGYTIMGRSAKKVENHWLSLMQVVGFTIENTLSIMPKIWYNAVC